MPFWPFLAVNNGFLCVFKNRDQNNICVSIVLKAKTEEQKFEKKLVDPQKRVCLSFVIKSIKKYFFIFFFSCSFKNNRRTHVILISICENEQKKSNLTFGYLTCSVR